MRHHLVLRTSVLIAALCLGLQGQDTPSKEAQAEAKIGTPPRASAADYQAHAQAGTVTIGAEFTRHSVPTFEGALSTDDFVVVEAGLFGAPGEKLKLSVDDFSLRVNGKKTALASQPYGVVLRSLKDPEWEPPVKPEKKSKTSMGGGGQGGEGDPPPVPPKMPLELQRAMAQRVQRASMPEGERPLPQAGLLFFEHRGKVRSVELIYAGPAGKATLTLEP